MQYDSKIVVIINFFFSLMKLLLYDSENDRSLRHWCFWRCRRRCHNHWLFINMICCTNILPLNDYTFSLQLCAYTVVMKPYIVMRVKITIFLISIAYLEMLFVCFFSHVNSLLFKYDPWSHQMHSRRYHSPCAQMQIKFCTK